MGMEPMHMSDEELVAWFADVGLDVEVVADLELAA